MCACLPFGTRTIVWPKPAPIGPFDEDLTLASGPPDPCPIAVDTETFSIFSLQGSHLNIRYFNQDLH